MVPVSVAQNETMSVSIVPGSASPFNGQFYVPNVVTISPIHRLVGQTKILVRIQ